MHKQKENIFLSPKSLANDFNQFFKEKVGKIQQTFKEGSLNYYQHSKMIHHLMAIR